MGMMGMFKWFRKDIVHRDRSGWSAAQKEGNLNNESYRNALQAFIDRRRLSEGGGSEAPASPDKSRADFLSKNNNKKCDNEQKSQERNSYIPGVPHIPPSEIFEIGWVAGTEDRYIELIFAEWQNTRIALRRHSHPECKDAVKADLNVLSEIRHPNVLLLMASTYTDEHGLVSILESIDCTLYHYIHDQGERISVQAIARCGGRLSDALRHSHMRGYVHTAISSHCVYLASNGVVKLGGWELAMNVNTLKPDREYEERLRTEIFRWQAPELFQNCEARKESDVYGLALLIWEMCTTHVPWSGYSKADVERHYVHWKRGVITDLYNFPPLLNNLLEAGLQLDVNKRTLDMNRMRRFLQRLEMQYEDEEPVYVDQHSSNNNEGGKTVSPTIRSPVGTSKSSKSSKLTKSNSAKQLFSAKEPESPTRMHFYTKRSKQNGVVKATAHIEQVNFFGEDIKSVIPKDNVQKTIDVLYSAATNYKKADCQNCSLETSDTVTNEEVNAEGSSQPWNSTYKKVKGPQETVEFKSASVYSSPLLDSADEESFKDARTNLKELKKTLAHRREHFFYGSETSSHTSVATSPIESNQMIIEAKSKHYEPHKPASHKTSLEPKCNKSPGQYDVTFIKSSVQQCRKDTYESLKEAILQPKVLNSDPQSFFENALWKKEKLICLSKMRKSYTTEPVEYPVQQTNYSDPGSAETTKVQTTESFSPAESGKTYVINEKAGAGTETSQELTQISEENNLVTESVETTTTQSKSLKILKDALDRATKIVRSLTPNLDDSYSLPCKEYHDFGDSIENNQVRRTLFEDLYDLRTNKDNEEIKTIERSTIDKSGLFIKNSSDSTATCGNAIKESGSEVTVSIKTHEKSGSSYDPTYNRNFVCESIAEVTGEFNACNDTELNILTESPTNKTTNVEETKSLANVQETVAAAATIDRNNVKTQVEIKVNDKKSAFKDFNLIFLNESPKGKNCKSCQNALPRRRSLPATLSQLRSLNNSTLGKLPIRRGDVPDSTLEDLYIDDEFGDSLNINMMLLDDDLRLDEDFMPNVTEL